MQTYSIAELDPPPLSGTEDGRTEVFGVNESDQVAGWTSFEAAWWDGLSLKKIPTPGSGSFGYAINDAAVVVGLNHFSYPTRAFAYVGGTFVDLGADLRGPDSTAIDVNTGGLIVGRAGTIADYRPFLYQLGPGTTTYLDLLPGTTMASASAVNDLNHVAGIASDGQADRAFLYRDGELLDMGTAQWLSGLNQADQAVGSLAFDGAYPWQAYRADFSGAAGVYENLGHSPLPGFTGSHGNGINSAGIVVGHSFKTPEDGHWQAFVHYPAGHPEAGFHDLAPRVEGADGWELEQATGINDRGVIVGNGSYLGRPRSFVLYPNKVRSRFDLDISLRFIQLLGGATVGGSGLGILPGGKPVPIPTPTWRELSASERDLQVGAAVQRLAAVLGNERAAEILRQAGREISELAADELRGR